MIDIRKVSLTFLNFIYENKILPTDIQESIDLLEEEKDTKVHIKYDISVILAILRYRDEYMPKSEEKTTYFKLNKMIESKRDALSIAQMDRNVYNWLKDADSTLQTLINIRNDFFHNVKKQIGGDTFLFLIKELIKNAPGDCIQDKYINELEKIEKSEKIQQEKTSSEILNKTINSKATSEKHLWTAEEEYLCAQKYIECFVLRQADLPLDIFIKDVHKCCPSIPYGSLKMKMQNIKWLCECYGITDTFPGKRLSSASQKCRMAVKQILEKNNLLQGNQL